MADVLAGAGRGPVLGFTHPWGCHMLPRPTAAAPGDCSRIGRTYILEAATCCHCTAAAGPPPLPWPGLRPKKSDQSNMAGGSCQAGPPLRFIAWQRPAAVQAKDATNIQDSRGQLGGWAGRVTTQTSPQAANRCMGWKGHNWDQPASASQAHGLGCNLIAPAAGPYRCASGLKGGAERRG